MKKIIDFIKSFFSKKEENNYQNDQKIFDLLSELKKNKKQAFLNYIEKNP
jgi:hypothetical protein